MFWLGVRGRGLRERDAAPHPERGAPSGTVIFSLASMHIWNQAPPVGKLELRPPEERRMAGVGVKECRSVRVQKKDGGKRCWKEPRLKMQALVETARWRIRTRP